MIKLDAATRAAIQKIIQENRALLEGIRGFVSAEPGFRIVNGWVRREPAIIIHVAEKLSAASLALDEIAPRAIGDVRVDVVTANADQLLAADPALHDVVDALELAAAGPTYAVLDGNPIDRESTLTRPVLCHAGPDAGWPVLRRFLEQTRDTLSIAIYDLNATHVAKTLVEVARSSGAHIVLVWDSGMTTDETTIRSDIKAKIDPSQLDAWVVRTGGGYRFDSAYHEKVAVQDRRAFWLSSGNWSKRSQPDIDPIAEPASASGMYSKGNREWHIMVEDPSLAALFEDYIFYDRDQSKEEDTALATYDPLMLPDLFVPLDVLLGEQDLALAVPRPVAPARLPAHGRPFKARPLLCPDNYIDRITEFVQSARQSLYLQFSYITYSEAQRDAPFQALLDYIGELSHRADFDLKIIVGNNSAQEKIRKLVEAGFNERTIRVQGNVHNKGIIVDGKAVLISSANWSSAGALRNRDAGLIIYDREVANYYGDIFRADWDERARQSFGNDRPVRLAVDGEATPPGMARVRWVDFMQDD